MIYGPMLRPGYPLRFDLVSVPRPVLGDDALGLGDRLPRAVPLDAAVALLARLLPDAWLTQLLGLLALVLAGWGVARLTPGPLPGRLLAVFVAEWNPFVVEQLGIGHVPHLFAYGALPWTALFARDLAGGRARGPALGGLLAVAGFGSLTPGGGVLCAIAAVAGVAAGRAGTRSRPRSGAAGAVPGRWALAGLAGVAALQLPWLVAAVAAPAFAGPAVRAAPAASARSAADAASAGLQAFALRPETGWGRLIDAAGLGGRWNAAALPASRETGLARASTVLLLALAVAGLPAARRLARAGWRPELVAGAGAAATGYLIAVLPVLPGGERLLVALIEAVPGAGLLRDGHRWLAPWALVLAWLAGLGAGQLAGWRETGPEVVRQGRRIAVALLAGLLVLATLPDAAGGLAGRLQARHYPADWARVRAVLDPAPRLLPRQTIVSDALAVGDRRLPEEGPGARRVAADLGDGALDGATLRSLAVGWVLIERGTPGPVPVLPVGWRPVLAGPDLTLVRAPGPLPAAPRPAPARAAAVLASQLLAGSLLLAGLLAGGFGLVSGASRRRGRAVRAIR